MIDAKELRIGNHVMRKYRHSTGKHEGFVVRDINKDGIGLICAGGFDGTDCSIEAEYRSEDLEPIPLTLNVLEACGFKKQKYEDWEAIAYKDTPICCHWDGVEWVFRYGYDSDLSFAACEYVHQLQNLMYVLIGEELNINL